MMISLRVSDLLLIIAILKTINCARILLVFPYVSVSHHIIGASLAAGLSESGHTVTLLSPNIHVDLYNLEFNGTPPYNWVKFETFCDPIESKSYENKRRTQLKCPFCRSTRPESITILDTQRLSR